jgi:HSP20 family molecular chaperone IbpA
MAPKKEVAVPRADQRPGVRLVRPERMEERIRDTFDAIARRAFEIFERNGGPAGRDWENWFQAESELFHPTHVEVAEADDVLTLKAEVPGFSEKDLQVSLEPRRVTITGKRETREAKKQRTLYTRQCSNEIFRVIDLPKEVDLTARGIKASYGQGVLTITLPEAESAKRRRGNRREP